AVVEQIRECHERGQPVLVGTTSVEKSQIIHQLLDRAKDRKSTRLNSSHVKISYAVFCLKKKKEKRGGAHQDCSSLDLSVRAVRRSQHSPRRRTSQPEPIPSSVIPALLHDPATPEISTLSLHDALPICRGRADPRVSRARPAGAGRHDQRREVADHPPIARSRQRSEEHTSELQSRENLVCRLLLEKKKRETRWSAPRLQFA